MYAVVTEDLEEVADAEVRPVGTLEQAFAQAAVVPDTDTTSSRNRTAGCLS
jgi:hypothetical protein